MCWGVPRESSSATPPLTPPGHATCSVGRTPRAFAQAKDTPRFATVMDQLPTLREVLEFVPKHIAFDVEIKVRGGWCRRRRTAVLSACA